MKKILSLSSAAVALVLSSCADLGHYGYAAPGHARVFGHASTVSVFGGNVGLQNRGFIAPRGNVFQRPLVVQQPVFGTFGARPVGFHQIRDQRFLGHQVSHRNQNAVPFRNQRPVQRVQQQVPRQQSRGRSQQPSQPRGMTMAAYQTRTPASAAPRSQSMPSRGASSGSRGQSRGSFAAPSSQVRNPRGR